MLPRMALPVAAHVVALALCSTSPARAQSSSELFEQGLESYRSGSYVEAQRLLREYVEANGERRGADPARLGEAYHYLGLMTPDPKLAEGYFLAVVQRYPTAPVADESLARLAELYTAQGANGEARTQWEALARHYPLSRHVPEVDLQVGQVHFGAGDLEPAYASFSAGFAKMKGFQRSGGQGANLRTLEGDYVYWLGRTLLARGAYGDARKYLNLVLLDYPDHPLEALALYHVAEAHRQEGKEKDAQAAWRRFSEAVRNTSLEPVAENPNLVAIARARVSGDLAPLSQRETSGAGTASRRETEGTVDRRDVGDDEGFGPAAEARPAPSEDEGLRAPEPGRPGGVVANEPLGRRVEEPAWPVDARTGQVTEAGAGAKESAVADDPAAAPASGDVEAAERAAAEREAAGRAVAEQAAGERAAAERAAADRAAAERAAVERETADLAAEERAAADRETADRAAEDRAREAQVLERAAAVAKAGERPPAGGERPEPLREIRPEGLRIPVPAPGAGTPKERILAEAAERPAVAPGTGAADSAVTTTPEAAAALEPIPPGSVYLQAGAFTSASSAAQLSTLLRKRGFEPQIHSGLVEGQAFYRVRFGPYEVPRDRAELEILRERLKKAGYEPLVRRAERSG